MSEKAEVIIEEVKTEAVAVVEVDTHGAPENISKAYRDAIIPATSFFTGKEEAINKLIQKEPSMANKKISERIRIDCAHKRNAVKNVAKPMKDFIKRKIKAVEGIEAISEDSSRNIEEKAVRYGVLCDEAEVERILNISTERHAELKAIGIETEFEGVGAMSAKAWAVMFNTEKIKEETRIETARIAQIESERIEAEEKEKARLKKIEDARIEAERLKTLKALEDAKKASDALLEKERAENKAKEQKAIDEAQKKQDEQDKKDKETAKELKELADLRAEKAEREKPTPPLCETIKESFGTSISEASKIGEPVIATTPSASEDNDFNQLQLFRNMIGAGTKLFNTYVFTNEDLEQNRLDILNGLTEFLQDAEEK